MVMKGRDGRVARIAFLLACFFARSPLPAIAEDAPPPGKAEFDKATVYFAAEEYEAALPYYRQAYELSGKWPSAIRALAQCERALKMYDEAIVHFREYLATMPPPPDSVAIERTVALLDDLRAERERQKPATESDSLSARTPPGGAPKRTDLAPPAPPSSRTAVTPGGLAVEERPKGPPLLTWILGGAAVVAAGTGAVFVVRRSAAQEELDGSRFATLTNDNKDDYEATIKRGNRDGVVAAIVFSVGGAALAGAAVTWIFGD